MSAVINIAPVPTRAQIIALEREILKQEQVEIAPTHYFAEGLYAREIRIPKGMLLTGAVHKFEHFNIISQGEITVWTEQGMKRLRAPCTLVSKPGTKRVGYAHEETVWTTIHACTLRDVKEIEALLVYSLSEQNALEDQAERLEELTWPL